MGWNPLRERREREFARLDAFRSARKLVDEDITVLAEQLAQLRDEALTVDPNGALRADYDKAVESLDQARSIRTRAETAEDVAAIEILLTEGRFNVGCAMARRDGTDLPTRREPCYFNAQHGPAFTDVAWSPQMGAEQQIEVCRLDADRLAAGEEPDVRMVRVGDRYVPWYAAGGSIATIVQNHAQVTHGRTADSDPYVNEARAHAAMGRMNERLNP